MKQIRICGTSGKFACILYCFLFRKTKFTKFPNKLFLINI